MIQRPAVSVIVPFAGSQLELERLLERLHGLRLARGDEVIVSDNRRDGRSRCEHGQIRTVAASGIQSAAFARNRAAAIATGEWLVFVDADTTPAEDLIDGFFARSPGERTAILAGGIVDVAGAQTVNARHNAARGQMSQEVTLRRRGSPYAQTANCAVRRSAFAGVGGFAEEARAGEDADLCFRLREAGWGLEERPEAGVAHHSRAELRAWLGQLLRHGSGAAWCNRRHPGTFPPPNLRDLAGHVRAAARRAVGALRRGDREAAAFALLDLAGACAFELGRLLPNRASGIA